MWTKEVSCDRDLLFLRRGSHRGTVLGVYRKCFHIQLEDGRILTVFGNIQEKMPLSITTDALPGTPFDAVPVEPGMDVFFEEGILAIPRAEFWCRLGGKTLSFDRKPLPVPKAVSSLENALLAHGKRNGAGGDLEDWLAWLRRGCSLPEGAMILRRVADVLEALDKNTAALENALLRSIGLGIGLTPSADDMICGIAAAARLYWPEPERERFLKVLEDFCENQGLERTTAISCQQLLLAARGKLSDPVYRLAEGLSYGAEAEIKDLALRVMDYGSSSGTELCMGFLAGIQKAMQYCESERNHKW